MEERVYRGWIKERPYGEALDVLFLSQVDEPLAMVLQEDMEDYGRLLTVRYFTADSERTLEELELELVCTVAGAAEATFCSHYSETTGYLWTTEELMVGGHDLLEELGSHLGEFCHLEVKFAREHDTIRGRA